MPFRLSTLLGILLILGLVFGNSAHAQRTSGAAGLGGQIGEPTGVTLKLYNADSPSYDFLVAWNLEEFFFFNAHALFEHPIDAENIDADVEWFLGPGGFVGFFSRGDDDAGLGISGTIGLNLIFDERLELYGQVTPRLNLIPETEAFPGGGLGVRYYF